jgi:hypothetical protein
MNKSPWTNWLLLAYRLNFLVSPFILSWALLSYHKPIGGYPLLGMFQVTTGETVVHIQTALGVLLFFVPRARQRHIILLTICSLIGSLGFYASPLAALLILVALFVYPINAKELYRMFIEHRAQKRLLGCAEHGDGIALKPVVLSKRQAFVISSAAFLVAGSAIFIGVRHVANTVLNIEAVIVQEQMKQLDASSKPHRP